MKKILYLFVITSIFATLSCSKWLDVKPRSEIKSAVMFETEQGFKDAIIGCYIMMSDQALYGGEMSATFLEVLAQQFEFNAGAASNRYYLASLYSYSGGTSKTIIDNIWSKIYTIIANVNNIIDELEKNKKVLHPTNYAMIKAEAYALRAFLHFDLMRLFSYGNLKNRSDVMANPAIPYVKAYDKVIVPQHTVKEVLSFLHDDINLAIELFEIYDPYSPYTNLRPEDYQVINDDNFYEKENRPYRFSLKAALATRMRINMWEGNYNEALVDAETLIKASGANGWGTSWISNSNINNSDQTQRDLTFSTEQLFGVETFERFDKVVKSYFKLTTSNELNQNLQCLYLTKGRAERLFEVGAGIGSADYRLNRLFDKSTEQYALIKYWEYERMKFTNQMPLIKKSEVYYTMAECLLAMEDKGTAIGYINNVRNARGIPYTSNLTNDLSLEQVKKELEKEWQKEFIGDGQMFFFYKRLGYTRIPYTNAVCDDALYIMPLPETEVDLGGRLDPNKEEKEK